MSSRVFGTLEVNDDEAAYCANERCGPKGKGFGHATSTQGPKVCLPPIVRGRHIDLAGGKIVVSDVNLIEIRRCLACENGQPWRVAEGRIDCGKIVDGPICAPVVAVDNVGLENEGQLLQGRHVHTIDPGRVEDQSEICYSGSLTALAFAVSIFSDLP